MTESLQFTIKNIEIKGTPFKILLQNENGPCALLAIVNLLLISPQHKRINYSLTELLEKKTSTVSLDEVNQVLANIALQSNTEMKGSNGADMDQLLELLPHLHTGLNINPKFDGTFEDSNEMALFRMFKIPIVHGWVIETLSKYSYESAQQVLLKAAEGDEEAVGEATLIQLFFDETGTQLTQNGLAYLNTILEEKGFVVLFRNDHFSTIYKENNQLYSLVTDLGYRRRKDIVWENIKSIDGSEDTFCDGNLDTIDLKMGGEEKDFKIKKNDNNKNNEFDPELTSKSLKEEMLQIENDKEIAKQLQQEEDMKSKRKSQKKKKVVKRQSSAIPTPKKDPIAEKKTSATDCVVM
ncbi:hypothetical protein NCAS_0H00940 [Naumovozyma castellii]|uniref:MINDY deubiquitinase domain-containing protein n=1 Tax=Naumovozyma castellii TaxID=27288 RepID=G0VIS7_NAUCA|nr:hypothetical protein NCAS_0H00940 [Naumovozyma castellii CBS 4309]CCC71404.1 hypothetical protein NCAS_0H00940 [Naumovozyma castellii CBS 4309]